MIEFRVLGPVEVCADGRSLPIGGPKPRALLAALLLARGRAVAVHELKRVLWDGEPPDTAPGVLQSYVSALRKALKQAGADVTIVTRSPGYLIDAAGTVDLAQFEDLVRAGRAAATDGQHVAAAAAFRDALACWRGPALAETTGLWLQAEAERLEEIRWTAVEEWAEATLAAGAGAGLVADLTRLVAQQPLRERLRGHLMHALVQAGRQYEALDVYHQGRRIVLAERGLEPGRDLQQLHEAILRSDESLHAPAAVAMAPAPPPTTVWNVPGQLPPDIRDLTGRDREGDALCAVLTKPQDGPAVMPVVVISGPSGIGKTSLAIRVAGRVRSTYPDGQLYVDLDASERAGTSSGEILARFLRATGLPPQEVPASADERLDLFRSRLAARRVLLLLDNVITLAQLNSLLPGGSACGVIVTSRRRLVAFPAAAGVHLEPLSTSDAVTLLGTTAGADRVTADPLTAEHIVELCGHLPLAVRTAGAKLALHPQWTVRELERRLAGERERLDVLDAGELRVRPSIALGLDGLPEVGRCAFRRLSMLDAPSFGTWMLAAVLDVPASTVERVIETLLTHYLVESIGSDQTGQPRYRIHHLLRVYGRELALAEEQPDEQAALLLRVMSGWQIMVSRVETPMLFGVLPVPLPDDHGWQPPEDAVLAAVTDPENWIEAEQEAMAAVVGQAAAAGLATHACALAASLLSFLSARNHFVDWLRAQQVAVDAVSRVNDRAARAPLLVRLGELAYERDALAEAGQYFARAIEEFELEGEAQGLATARAGLATVHSEQGRFREAISLCQQALPTFTAESDAAALVYLHNVIARVHLELGEFSPAADAARAALALAQSSGNRQAEAFALRNLGLIHRAQDDIPPAVDYCRRAHTLLTEFGGRLSRAYACLSLAKSLIRADQHEEAKALLDWTLDTCRDLRDDFGQALALRTFAELCLAQNSLSACETYVSESLRQWRRIQAPLWHARTLTVKADLDDRRGRYSDAMAARAEAAETFAALGCREQYELHAAVVSP
ncbi:BTAD domain-containing putative transcriptional regulator [Kutzneria sp. NPDC051319]|uniref:AfsR/SARP family transcriptional regulator n=1 Tax=Kutzneria sp. NPDC051319 TaxID=3155047 RepID=UPI003439F670